MTAHSERPLWVAMRQGEDRWPMFYAWTAKGALRRWRKAHRTQWKAEVSVVHASHLALAMWNPAFVAGRVVAQLLKGGRL